MRKIVLSVLCSLFLLASTATAGTVRTFPGGWFVDAYPTGEYVVMVPSSHLDTHAGRVPLPPGEPWGIRYVAATTTGGWKFAGQSQTLTGRTFEWTGSAWRDLPFVTGRGIYDRNGAYADQDPGYQYLTDDGQLVSRLFTYAPFNGINEWSSTGGLFIGQGMEAGGVLVWDGTVRRTLDTGTIFFIRVHRVGNAVTVSYVKNGTGAVIVQTTLDELRALPEYRPTTEPPPVTPPTPPTPVVNCGEIPALGQKLLRQLAEKYADEIRSQDDEQRRLWAMRAAQQLAFSVGPTWGTKRADDGRPLSKDAVAKVIDGRLCGWDIVNGATRELTFGQGADLTGQVFVPVTPKNHLVDTPPAPPEPAKCDYPDLRAEWAKCDTDIRRLHELYREAEEAVSEAGARADALQRELDALKNKPAPRCEVHVSWWVRALGVRPSCRVVQE